MGYAQRFWRRNSVPTFPVEIDPRSPLSKGLVYSALPALSLRDLSEHQPAAIVHGSITPIPSVYGPSMYSSGVSTKYISASPFSGVSNRFSLLCVASSEVASQTSYAPILALGQLGGSRTYTFSIQDNGHGSLRLNCGDGSTAYTVGSYPYTNHENLVCVARYDGTKLFFSVNGVEYSSTVSFTPYVSSQLYYLGSVNQVSSVLPWNGTVNSLSIWNEAVPLNVLRNLQSEPFAMFKPRRQVRYFVPSSGTTLTVASVTHGHSDSVPSLSALYAVTPANVSQGHTDQNVNVTQGVALAAQNVSQGHSDSSSTISVSYSLTVQSLAHGHSDTSPSFNVLYALTPATVSHGHTDSSPILTTGTLLLPANASQGHADSSPTITQHSTLSISNIVHGQSVSNVTLTLPAHWTKGSAGALVSWTQSSATSMTWTKETTPSSSVWTH